MVTGGPQGFDTYKGYLDGAESYWCHGGCGPRGAKDWWDSARRENTSLALNPVFNESCLRSSDKCPAVDYSATLLGDRAVQLIHATPSDPQKRPMFMYLAWQSGGRKPPPASSLSYRTLLCSSHLLLCSYPRAPLIGLRMHGRSPRPA